MDNFIIFKSRHRFLFWNAFIAKQSEGSRKKKRDDLEPVRNEAIQFLTMENDIVKKKNLLYQKYQ